MAVVKPFPAIRPQAVKAAQIAALPYDVFTREEAVKEIEKHPLSFLRVDRPGNKFSGRDGYVQSPGIRKGRRASLEAGGYRRSVSGYGALLLHL